MTLIRVENLYKTYRLGRVDVPVLRGACLTVERGEWLAVLGASGSGKSTLLHLMGALDRPDRGGGKPPGDVFFDGRALSSLSARELDRFRAERVGFVFQFYHLLPELNVLENVMLAAMILGAGDRHRRQAAAAALLDTLGLGHRLRHRPAELSGGERQRVAIARALINEPEVLLADEPTGNLDRATGATILEAIAQMRRRRGQTVVMVTHDPDVARHADRVVRLEDGRVVGG